MNSKNKSLKHGGIFEEGNFAGKIAQLEAETYEADFWNDNSKAEKVMGELKSLKSRYEPWEKLRKDIEDLEVFYELAGEEKDESQTPEIEETFKELKNRFEKQNIIE